ncbi:MAG: CpcT/CpeT family chromophore lyase [Hyphomonadaceae bacterium]|nr:CpcT/CpeT family chromophore lyase [Hyphomonadaceae bacterium]
MRPLLAALLLVAGCASGPTGDDLAVYPAAIAGRYDNSVQYAGAPADMKDAPGDPEDDWLDAQAVTFTPVEARALGPAAVYAEWKSLEGAVTRQRLWLFRSDAGGVRLDIVDLATPERFAGAGPAAFTTLSRDDVTTPDPACALSVTASGRGAWNAQTDPDTCRRGDVSVDIRITVMPTGVLYQEQGRRPDGTYAFRTPSPAPYDFRRR